jgi:hypothetical protein
MYKRVFRHIAFSLDNIFCILNWARLSSVSARYYMVEAVKKSKMTDDKTGNMSQVSNIPIPEKFDGGNGPKQGDLWPKWIRRFERYRIASGLNNISDLKNATNCRGQSFVRRSQVSTRESLF